MSRYEARKIIAAHKWKSVKKELPKLHKIPDETVGDYMVSEPVAVVSKDVYRNRTETTVGTLEDDLDGSDPFWVDNDLCKIDYVTHWMELPELPKEDF